MDRLAIHGSLRGFATALHDVVLEASGSPLLPSVPDPLMRYELAVVLADLRHLEDFLGMARAQL